MTWVNVEAFIGNGKPSAIQTLLSWPPVLQETATASQVPAGTVTVLILVGRICSPPMFAILHHATARNSFGSSCVAHAVIQTIEDLNASL